MWRWAGARTQDEARGFIIGQLRRRIGLVASEAMASHRLGRVPWIGVPRHVVANRRTLAGAGGGARPDRDGVVDAQAPDFFAPTSSAASRWAPKRALLVRGSVRARRRDSEWGGVLAAREGRGEGGRGDGGCV